jgi:hypothetical protein
LSTPTVSPLPSFFAAKASTPVPMPTSSTEQPGFADRNASTAARHSDVVGWSPVPNAIFGSMKRHTLSAGAFAFSHGGPTHSRPTVTDLMRSRHETLQSCSTTGSTRTGALGRCSFTAATASSASTWSS